MKNVSSILQKKINGMFGQLSTKDEFASHLRNNELGEFTPFTVRILIVPENVTTHLSRMLAANKALRNDPRMLGVLGKPSENVN